MKVKTVQILCLLSVLSAGTAYVTYSHDAFAQHGGGKPGAGGAPGGAAQAMPVEGTSVAVGTMARTVEAVGTLQSDENVIIRPEIAGRITEILFKEGEKVKKGQVLVRIDSSVTRAELASAEAALNLSQTNYNRAVKLFESKTVSEKSVDETSSKVKVDKANVDLAKAYLAKTEIRAPFSGVIGLRSISAGAYVTPGQDIVNLENIDTLKVDFRIAETYLPMLSVGQQVKLSVDAFKNKEFDGEVYAIDPRVDESGRSIMIRAHVENENGALRPGLFARVGLVVEKHENALMIPEQAIIPNGEQKFVYRVVDGKATMTPVVTGLRRNGEVEIVSGLAASETVITAGHSKIPPGAPVMILPPGGMPELMKQKAMAEAAAKQKSAGNDNKPDAKMPPAMPEKVTDKGENP